MTDQKPSNNSSSISINNMLDKKQSKQKTDQQEQKNIYQYAPKYNTQAFDLLKALLDIKGYVEACNPVKIRERFEINKGRKMKLRGEVKKRLIDYGFIELEPQNQYIKLTLKGKSHVEQVLRKQQNQKNDIQPSKSNSKRANPKRSASAKQRSVDEAERQKQRVMKMYVNSEYPRCNITSKQRIGSCKGADNIKMMISHSNFSSDVEKEVIVERISKLTGSINEVCDIEIGDFAWIMGGKMLDYLILRIRMEDFDVEQYKFKCLRAKSSGCDYISVIFQFPDQHDQKDKTRRVQMTPMIKQIIASTRIYGLKVIVANGMEQSISYLKKMTWGITKKVRNLPKTGDAIYHFGHIERFNACNKYTRYTKLQRITIKCMSCFGFDKKCLIRFARKYPTFKMIFLKLQQYRGFIKKQKVIKHLLEKETPEQQTVQLFLNFLFLKSYGDQYVKEKQQKIRIKMNDRKQRVGSSESNGKSDSNDYSEDQANIFLFDEDFGMTNKDMEDSSRSESDDEQSDREQSKKRKNKK